MRINYLTQHMVQNRKDYSTLRGMVRTEGRAALQNGWSLEGSLELPAPQNPRDTGGGFLEALAKEARAR